MSKLTYKNNENNQFAKKDKYRVTNWRQYNNSLKNRCGIGIWVDEDSLKNWYYKGPKRRGAQFIFSDECIICLLQIKAIFKLPYRQLEGFVDSVFRSIGIDIEIPSYTQICRRAKELEIDIEVPSSNEAFYLVVDSTGLKIFGDGEWKARKHGPSKRRTWRKLHLGIDEKTGYIHSESLTKNGVADAEQVPQLINQAASKIDRFSGDGAYDKYHVWNLLQQKNIEGIIPPQKNAVYWVDELDNLLDLDRNKIIDQIDKSSRREWKVESGYHRRSLSETAMMRFKTIFGSTLYSREFEKQKTETRIKIKCLNKMTKLGMPESIKRAS